MNGRRLQFGVAVIDDKLFVIGGRDGLKTLNTVECYNPKTKTWTVLPPMSTHRHGLDTKMSRPQAVLKDLQSDIYTTSKFNVKEKKNQNYHGEARVMQPREGKVNVN
ncbi:Kelch-like protein 1 [Camelus dromedarius]|uniref:Kelch-like protein 1 n=1 Tax=Camelus dromedarius TaxID=9838 RepID=A0A5N4D8X3_CAMDR|nr:Kelch-like protein 1 [Camelus dromedarius]